MNASLLALATAAMITTMAMSLSDHAGQAAAYDLASARAARAARHLVRSCAADECVKPAEAAVCVDANGLVVSSELHWTPKIWRGLTPVTASRVLVYDTGFAADDWAEALLEDLENCT